ncbi:hypothetical protein [Nocardioides sp.]|uniref:hypothetical protein n=1 Tax=Nocardioides sp. TaxID=35761 RepID=UPI00271716FF|nr:hypothetical protein [Nocardioides sp.]MDO9457262.1 hypothetical protein [Nocardioides sp.]
MATKYDVRVTEASASATRFHAVCACSCGWYGNAEATREPVALAEAARERVEHLLEAHPKQTPSAFFRPRAHARYKHPRSLSAASPHGKRWSRYAACACGWTDTVKAGSPDGAARVARARHRAHVQLQTGRTPWRDYAVMALVVLVVVGLCVALAVVAIEAAGGDPKDLTDLGSLLG